MGCKRFLRGNLSSSIFFRVVIRRKAEISSRIRGAEQLVIATRICRRLSRSDVRLAGCRRDYPGVDEGNWRKKGENRLCTRALLLHSSNLNKTGEGEKGWRYVPIRTSRRFFSSPRLFPAMGEGFTAFYCGERSSRAHAN